MTQLNISVKLDLRARSIHIGLKYRNKKMRKKITNICDLESARPEVMKAKSTQQPTGHTCLHDFQHINPLFPKKKPNTNTIACANANSTKHEGGSLLMIGVYKQSVQSAKTTNRISHSSHSFITSMGDDV